MIVRNIFKIFFSVYHVINIKREIHLGENNTLYAIRVIDLHIRRNEIINAQNGKCGFASVPLIIPQRFLVKRFNRSGEREKAKTFDLSVYLPFVSTCRDTAHRSSAVINGPPSLSPSTGTERKQPPLRYPPGSLHPFPIRRANPRGGKHTVLPRARPDRSRSSKSEENRAPIAAERV